MALFDDLMLADAAAPRLTCYDEVTGGRTELSGTTLENWAAKIANLLRGECGLAPGDAIAVDLPPIWQAGCLLVGAWRAEIEVLPVLPEDFTSAGVAAGSNAAAAAPASAPQLVFTTVNRLDAWEEAVPGVEVAVLTDDAFGRGVAECGGDVPFGVMDFAPEVRIQPDAYFGGQPDASHSLVPGMSEAELTQAVEKQKASSAQELADGARLLSAGWLDESGRFSPDAWLTAVVAPWAVGGSAVVVRAGSAQRLAHLAEMEKAQLLG